MILYIYVLCMLDVFYKLVYIEIVNKVINWIIIIICFEYVIFWIGKVGFNL